jgi:hypothetical protein
MPKIKPKIPMILLLEAIALTSKRSLACLYTTSGGKSKEKIERARAYFFLMLPDLADDEEEEEEREPELVEGLDPREELEIREELELWEGEE